jgi:catechol 2,3-dioxygenase-like lactoylglutathione lyase family enzyme
MSTTATGLRTISLVCVPTIDQDTAVAFYESIGFETRVDTEFGGRYRWIEVYPAEGSTGIALAPPPPDAQGAPGEVIPIQTGITLTTDDIDATHAQFQALGADIDAEVSRMGGPVPPIVWFRDPSGHTLMIVENPPGS